MAVVSQEISICDATVADAAAIAEIYNWAVLNTSATADTDPQSVTKREAWLEERHRLGYAVLVAKVEDEVVGWAALNPYNLRSGYRFTAENSVYIAPDFQGQGIGRVLLGEIIERAKAAGMHRLIASMDSENAASIKLHENFGFTLAGRYEEMVHKFGRWLDVVHYQRSL